MGVRVILALILLNLSLCFVELASKVELAKLFDFFPEKPALIIYESSTANIREHEAVYQKLYQSTKDYALVLVIDCERNVLKEGKDLLEGCPGVIQHQTQLVAFQGYIPKPNMLSVRGKMFRLAPEYIQNQVERSFESLFNIVEYMIPNYVEKLYSKEDIESFLGRGSYLLPRVFVYTDSQEYTSIQKLCLYFSDRAKFGQVLVKEYAETKLVVSSYDFNENEWKQHTFPGKISFKEYENMKEFIEGYASKALIREEYDYLRVDASRTQYANKENYTRVVYQSTQKYTLVFQGEDTDQGERVIQTYKERYGEFINYILYLTPGEPSLYLTHMNQTKLELDKAQLPPFSAYRFEDVEKNAQNLMDLGNIIFLVEPALDYFCSIENLRVVSGFLNCYPIAQQDVDLVKSKFNIPREDQMAILFSTDQKGTFVGKNINNLTFPSVVSITYNVVRNRIKTLAKQFSSNPIFPILQGVPYSKICKNCFLYLHSPDPNSVIIENYKKQALENSREMPFYFGYTDCHSELFKEIKKEPHEVLVFISEGKIFWTKEVSGETAGKVVKRWKQGKLKMTEITEELKTDSVCAHNDKFRKEDEGEPKEEKKKEENEQNDQL